MPNLIKTILEGSPIEIRDAVHSALNETVEANLQETRKAVTAKIFGGAVQMTETVARKPWSKQSIRETLEEAMLNKGRVENFNEAIHVKHPLIKSATNNHEFDHVKSVANKDATTTHHFHHPDGHDLSITHHPAIGTAKYNLTHRSGKKIGTGTTTKQLDNHMFSMEEGLKESQNFNEDIHSKHPLIKAAKNHEFDHVKSVANRDATNSHHFTHPDGHSLSVTTHAATGTGKYTLTHRTGKKYSGSSPSHLSHHMSTMEEGLKESQNFNEASGNGTPSSHHPLHKVATAHGFKHADSGPNSHGYKHGKGHYLALHKGKGFTLLTGSPAKQIVGKDHQDLATAFVKHGI